MYDIRRGGALYDGWSWRTALRSERASDACDEINNDGSDFKTVIMAGFSIDAVIVCVRCVYRTV